MAVKKKVERRTPVHQGGVSKRLMDNQDTLRKGDSRAVRTAVVSFSTTDDIADAVREAAFERRMSRSKLIEEALVAYLGI